MNLARANPRLPYPPSPGKRARPGWCATAGVRFAPPDSKRSKAIPYLASPLLCVNIAHESRLSIGNLQLEGKWGGARYGGQLQLTPATSQPEPASSPRRERTRKLANGCPGAIHDLRHEQSQGSRR
jgi:hypothetical protein